MQNTPNPHPQRPRSPRFPFIPLRKAVDFTRTLHQEFGVEPVGAPRALKAMGFDAPSGKANKVVAALKAYGLIDRDRGAGAQLNVSPAGAKLATESVDSNLKTLRLAALEPLPFRRIWHNRPGITEQELANILEQRRFTEQGARRAARIYTANVRFAKLNAPGFRESNNAPPLPAGNARGRGQRPGANAEVVRAAGATTVPQRLRVPLGDDFANIPLGLSKEDFQLLIQTLRLWKSQIVAK